MAVRQHHVHQPRWRPVVTQLGNITFQLPAKLTRYMACTLCACIYTCMYPAEERHASLLSAEKKFQVDPIVNAPRVGTHTHCTRSSQHFMRYNPMYLLLEKRACGLAPPSAPIQDVGEGVQRQPREAHVAHHALLPQLRQRWQRLVDDLPRSPPTSAIWRCLSETVPRSLRLSCSSLLIPNMGRWLYFFMFFYLILLFFSSVKELKIQWFSKTTPQKNSSTSCRAATSRTKVAG